MEEKRIFDLVLVKYGRFLVNCGNILVKCGRFLEIFGIDVGSLGSVRKGIEKGGEVGKLAVSRKFWHFRISMNNESKFVC
jgi:hypothetical protein